MKKGVIKEEVVPKISITSKRTGEEFDDDIVKKFIEKKNRTKSN